MTRLDKLNVFVFLIGLFSITWGAWLIYRPAGFIVLGMILVFVTLVDGFNERIDKDARASRAP